MSYLNPKSLTFWSGVVLVLLGALRVHTGDTEGGLRTLTEGLGIIGIRRAIGG